MSTPLVIEVTVPRYRLFERPGRHRIRVMHDLGWAVDHGGGHRDWQMLETPGEDDPRWVETTIEMFEPPAEEIDKILDVMKEGPRRGDQSGLRRNAAWSDFETIRHPAYLPALVKRARARGSHEPEWLVGIRSIETPDATRALVDLLTEGGLERRAAALVDRVPRPEVVPELIEHAAMVHPDRAVQARGCRVSGATSSPRPFQGS